MSVEVLVAMANWSFEGYAQELEEMGIEPTMPYSRAKAQADAITAECRARCGKWHKENVRGQHDKFQKAL